MTVPSPQQQLAAFIAKYDPKVARTAAAALVTLRNFLPGAIELVYDNDNALAIGFGPSERNSEAIFSPALWPRRVTLFFFTARACPIREVCCKAAVVWRVTSCSSRRRSPFRPGASW